MLVKKRKYGLTHALKKELTKEMIKVYNQIPLQNREKLDKILEEEFNPLFDIYKDGKFE